jgi:hypothetical protein
MISAVVVCAGILLVIHAIVAGILWIHSLLCILYSLINTFLGLLALVMISTMLQTSRKQSAVVTASNRPNTEVQQETNNRCVRKAADQSTSATLLTNQIQKYSDQECREAARLLEEARHHEHIRRLAAEQRSREMAAAERRARMLAAAEAAYCSAADAYIRARRDFDGAAPTARFFPMRDVERGCRPPPGVSPEVALSGSPQSFEVLSGRVRLLRLTPHRDPGRVFGEYRCTRCRGRWWGSGYSYADSWQKCRGCETPVYPFAQRPLERGDPERDGPPHDQSRCGMCRRLGRSCCRD